MAADFRIRYWGVTGSFPCPLTPDEVQDLVARAIRTLAQQSVLGALARPDVSLDEIHRLLTEHLSQGARATYGGNTTCIEIETPDALMILDAGSGFRGLGVELSKRWAASDFRGRREAHVLLTHPHIDHTIATPFFDPYYDPRNKLTLWAPQSVLDSLHALLDPRSAWRSVYFPPTYDIMQGLKEFKPVTAGESFSIGGARISTLALSHPGGCLAYRLERNGKRIVFASDHEHQQAPDAALVEFAADADLLYMDAQYTRDEYQGRAGLSDEPPAPRTGWGHSTYRDAIATAVAAGAARIHLGHHDPKRRPETLDALLPTLEADMKASLAEANRPLGATRLMLVHEGHSVEV